MSCWPNVGSLLGQSHRRLANNKPTLGGRLMFAGNAYILTYYHDYGHINRSRSQNKNDDFGLIVSLSARGPSLYVKNMTSVGVRTKRKYSNEAESAK